MLRWWRFVGGGVAVGAIFMVYYSWVVTVLVEWGITENHDGRVKILLTIDALKID
jgi:hypothetical protein